MLGSFRITLAIAQEHSLLQLHLSFILVQERDHMHDSCVNDAFTLDPFKHDAFQHDAVYVMPFTVMPFTMMPS